MDYKRVRETIRSQTSNSTTNIQILQSSSIGVTKKGFIRVRPEDRTPSCKLNEDGSFYDFGSGEYYKDIISLLFDGFHAFDSLSDTMKWVCSELNIQWEVPNEYT